MDKLKRYEVSDHFGGSEERDGSWCDADEVTLLEAELERLRVELAAKASERPTSIDLWYPNVEGNPKSVTVCLVTVRAANDLNIGYDFSRDGWVVKMQPSRDGDGMMEDVGEPIEVAFVDAWIGPDGEAI